ncbi:PRD domain-containing protein [Brooklawnia sp.]
MSVLESFPDAAQAAQKVRVLLEMRLGTSLTDDEATYLILHIARLTGK